MKVVNAKSNDYIIPYVGQQFHRISFLGLTRILPIVEVNSNTWIPYLRILGDREMIEKTSEALLPLFRKTEIIATVESTGIPLAYQLAKLLDHEFYVVCRKSVKGVKANVVNYIIEKYRSTTSSKTTTLLLDSNDAALVRDKKVGLVDDVTSSFSVLNAMNKLIEKAEGEVIQRGVVMLEGMWHADIAYVGNLPLFKKKIPTIIPS